MGSGTSAGRLRGELTEFIGRRAELTQIRQALGTFVTGPGGAPKPIALTGGTGTYRNIGGDGTLVEFGNGKGRLNLHVLSLGPGGGES